MSKKPYRIGLLSDFNTQNFAALIQKVGAAQQTECVDAPFGQTAQLLLDDGAAFWANPFDAVVVWAMPQIAAPTFQRVLDCESFSVDELLAEVDAFADLVKRAPRDVRAVFVPTFVSLGTGRGLGALDVASNVGIANALMRMNLRLAEQVQTDRRILLLDTQRWLTSAGANSYSAKLWYMSKTPFHASVFRDAAADVLAALDGINGRSKKVVILDLDNTMWGGIVGDDGWEKLRIGGHDAVGEAFADFQRGLKRLSKRGIVLAIASKNEESVALEAIAKHSEMQLSSNDFAAWRINWNDKAQNIAELMSELNLGLDSAVFLDDSPFERARVRETLPQVLVPELPADPLEYPGFLSQLRCFDNPVISAEDRARTTMYVADRQRSALKTQGNSLEDWLKLLDLRVTAEPLDAASLDRAAQLFNKTNQMNLSTRRMTAAELLDWSQQSGHRLWTFRVADKFGDYGLCGIGSFEHIGARGKLTDFILSCRVMGRGVESTILHVVSEYARQKGCTELVAELSPTPKNKPCEKWFANQSSLKQDGNMFQMSLTETHPAPAHVRIEQ